MNFPTKPHLRLDEVINHEVDTSLVCGFRGRDLNNGVNAVVLKGGLLPGGDECVGIYNDIEEAVVTSDYILYIITEKAVHAAGGDTVSEAPPHTFDDAPLYGLATMACVPLDDFSTWDRDEVTIE